MRLLEFVTCGRPAALPEDSPPSPRQTDKAAPASPRLTEEEAVAETPLSPTTCAYPDKRRRRPSHGSASPWRPSLVAISEDGTPAPAPPSAVCSKGGGRGCGSRTTRAKSTGRILPRTERADFRYYGVPTVVPAFAPTAFLF